MSRKRKKHAKPPEFLRTLSTPPNGSWSRRAMYHGSRIALVVILAAMISWVFKADRRELPPQYALGQIAGEDVAAEVGFQVPVDSADLEQRRLAAAASVPRVFQHYRGTQERVETRINEFFDQIQRAVESGGRPAVEAVLMAEDLLDALGGAAAAEIFLNPNELEGLREATLDVVRALLDRALYADEGEAARTAGRIRVREEGEETYLPTEDLLWGPDLYTAVAAEISPRPAVFEGIVRDIFSHFFESPYDLDEVATEVELERARSAVPTVETDSVLVGEMLVRDGDRIGPYQLRRLTAHFNALQAEDSGEGGLDWLAVLGSFLLNLLLLGIFGVLLYFYRPEVYGTFRWVFLIFLLALSYFLAAWGLTFWPRLYWQLLPIAFVVLPVAILWDGRMALILALVLGVLSGAQEPFSSFHVLAFTVVGGAAAALSARAVRRRSQVWIFIALITLAYALVLSANGLIARAEAITVAQSIGWAATNAIISAILAMGFMPVFEWFTGITTDQTLLEWADPNRKLLKSLSLEASGTYAHTINVANLAEAAATAIGANGLLARVGVYYHDVGKMLKPQYFVENQPGGRNPHDKLKPHTSASLVREHVIEGERMARDEGVPDVVARFIPEHHGTQLIGFFYGRAKEESEEEPDPEAFRYPGPKPQSRETAIAMLADSVESATRVLQDASPERIRELVSTIVEAKTRDGQLSESPLTFRDLSLIQEQFVKVVSGMFHHRLDYPETRHITEVPKEEGGPPAAGENGRPSDSGQAPEDGSDPSAAQASQDEGPPPEEGPPEEVPGPESENKKPENGPRAEQLPLTPPGEENDS